MAMTNEQLTKWIDEIFGTIDEIKVNSGDISGLSQSVRQLRQDLTATQGDVSALEGDVSALEADTAGTVSMTKAQLQHFTDGSATQALDLVADIIPVQAGSGDPSPTNVRAITGFSSVTAKAGGENFWADGNITVNDHTNYVPLGIKFTGKVAISLSVTSDDTDAQTCAMVFFYENGTNSAVYQWDRGSRQSKALDFGTNVVVAIAFYASDNYNHGTGDTATWSNIQVEHGETATEYTAPDINTATISLGSTVYGGTVNFTTGELTIDKAIVDLGTLTYTYQEAYTRFYTSFSPTASVPNDQVADALCSAYKMVSSAETVTPNDKVISISESKNIIIRDTDYTDATAFKAALDGVKLVYPLATPTTTTLTPAQLSLLQGENNVSATSGPITLTYAPDNVLAEIYSYVQDKVSRINTAISALDTRVYALEHPTTTNTRKTTKTLTKKED